MGGLVGIQYISLSLLQLENALLPMDVTFCGITIFVKLLQPENVVLSIIVILLLIIAVIRFAQPWNTEFPSVVTLLGIVIFSNLLQLDIVVHRKIESLFL